MSNPYYERRIERRKNLIEVFNLAKANGCECYFTPEESNYDYGFMIFPDGTIMYGQNGDFWGWKFSIEYKPSREAGTGCSCNDEPVTEIDWNTLVAIKNSGLAYAHRLGANMYSSGDEWKRRYWNFDKLIKL